MRKLKTTLFIKAGKENQNGDLAVYVKIQVNMSKTTFDTGFFVDPIKWRETHQFKFTRKLEEMKVRHELDTILEDLADIYEILTGRNMKFSATKMKEVFKSGDYENMGDQLMLAELFDHHEKMFKPMVESGNRSPATLQKYRTLRKHVNEFMLAHYGIKDIELPGLNFEFIDSLDTYLRTVKRIANNPAVKYIQSLRTIVRMAVKYDWLAKDPFLLYDKKIKRKDAVYLTTDELTKIEEVELATDRLKIVKDIFVLNCYTGFAPVDLFKLTRENLVVGNDGQTWIVTSRQKTGIKSDVPLLPKAKDLIDKYKDHVDCKDNGLLLPKRSNQKMNEYLKEIASFAGVHKNLTHYVARHTFATTVILANGLSMEVLSKMLGHTNLRQTAHYGKIQNVRVGQEMSLLREKMSKK